MIRDNYSLDFTNHKLYSWLRVTRLSHEFSIDLNQSAINQSVKIYIALLQDTYLEALPTQAKRKRTVLRRLWNENRHCLGGALGSNVLYLSICIAPIIALAFQKRFRLLH